MGPKHVHGARPALLQDHRPQDSSAVLQDSGRCSGRCGELQVERIRGFVRWSLTINYNTSVFLVE